MMKTLTVLEYAQEIGVAPATVYRRIDRGELQAICEDGVKKIVVPDENHRDTSAIQNEKMVLHVEESTHFRPLFEYIKDLKRQIERLEAQNEELLRELHESRQREDESRQRSDTIILQLTRQFEEQTKLIEDMHHRSLWLRVKTAFGFAAS